MDLIAQAGQLAHQLISDHPIIYTLLVVPIFLYLVRKLEAAIPAIADWADAYQEKALKRAGLSDEEIALLEEHEGDDMIAAGNELKAKAAARRAAPAAPAGQATPTPKP